MYYDNDRAIEFVKGLLALPCVYFVGYGLWQAGKWLLVCIFAVKL